MSAPDEAERLRILADYAVMDTAPERELDELVSLASAICGTPIALVSLVDDHRQWFKAKVGLTATETPRSEAFCAHAIGSETPEDDAIFTIPDARLDARFADNPLVVNDPSIVFYAGAPLVVEGGAKLGTLCVIDREPRVLTPLQERTLRQLAKVVVQHLELRRALVQRRGTETQLHAVLHSIADAVIVTDSQGNVTFLNPVAEALAVKPKELAVGAPLLETFRLLDGDTRKGLESPLAPVLLEGRTAKLAERAILVRADGTEIPIDESAVPVRNADGTVMGAVLVIRDVTEQNRLAAEREQLRIARARAERELARIFDLSRDLLGWSSTDGYFRRVNPAFTAILGWTADELYASPINDFVHPDDLAATSLQRKAVSSGAGSMRFENRMRCHDDSYRWISWSAVHEDGLNYLVARDITEEKATVAARAALLEDARLAQETAEKANRAMDEFLATVSHELRTPLNAMLGWTRLLRADTVPESARPKALETIERNATMQAQLIEDLLDVSRIMSGKMRLEMATMELVVAIEGALDVVRPAADAKGVTLLSVLDEAASHVYADAGRLQQVAWNLVANAVKFTPRGGKVTVRLRRGDGHVELSITDTGQGISADFIHHVFERFKQADGATTRAYGGLGLGLAIVKNIVELHGGTVAVSSKGRDQGSVFVVRLPSSLVRPRPGDLLAPVPESSRQPMALDAPQEMVGLRILVVDDEPDASELLAAVLERCGAVVRTAGSVAEALAAIDGPIADLPAVVVSDIGMPGEDGYSFIKKLRQRPVELGGRIPVVALTAYARTEDRTRALRAGFNMHMTKPVEPAELLAVVVSLMQRTSDI